MARGTSVTLGAAMVLAAVLIAVVPADAHGPVASPTDSAIRELLTDFPDYEPARAEATTCLSAKGYTYDRDTHTVTLPDGGTLVLPSDRSADAIAVSLSGAYQDFVRASDRCNEESGVNSILESAGVIEPPPPVNDRVAFYNEIERTQHGCMVDKGWELGEILTNRFGQLEYEWRPRQDHERWDEWVTDIEACRIALFGWVDPPAELIPPVTPQD